MKKSDVAAPFGNLCESGPGTFADDCYFAVFQMQPHLALRPHIAAGLSKSVSFRPKMKAVETMRTPPQAIDCNYYCIQLLLHAIIIEISFYSMEPYMSQKPAAENMVRELLTLGWTQKRIAAALEVNESTISRAVNSRDWPVSDRLVESLRELVASVRSEVARAVAPQLSITVIGWYGSKPTSTDEEIKAAISTSLRSALTSLGESSKLPMGIQGAMAEICNAGAKLYLCAINPELSDTEQRHVLDELSNIKRDSREQTGLDGSARRADKKGLPPY